LASRCALGSRHRKQRRQGMNQIIYIVGLVVVVIAVLSFFGLR
jgi:predicted nucleic acid-binding Zn ribbon protein